MVSHTCFHLHAFLQLPYSRTQNRGLDTHESPFTVCLGLPGCTLLLCPGLPGYTLSLCPDTSCKSALELCHVLLCCVLFPGSWSAASSMTPELGTPGAQTWGVFLRPVANLSKKKAKNSWTSICMLVFMGWLSKSCRHKAKQGLYVRHHHSTQQHLTHSLHCATAHKGFPTSGCSGCVCVCVCFGGAPAFCARG